MPVQKKKNNIAKTTSIMEKNAKIYMAGHHGLVGSAIWKNLQEKGYTNLIGKTHKELDLLDGVAVRRFFDTLSRINPNFLYPYPSAFFYIY